MSAETKVWYSVKHGANGVTSVTASIQDGNLSVKWSVKTFASTIKEGVVEAEKGARKALADLKAAVAGLEEGQTE